jgi:hypothetical protein
VAAAIDAQLLQTFDEATDRWNFAAGNYEIVVVAPSDNMPLQEGSRSIEYSRRTVFHC